MYTNLMNNYNTMTDWQNLTKTRLDLNTLQYHRISGKVNKNVWLPNDVAVFVRVQHALDVQPGSRVRVADVINGLVRHGHWQLVAAIANREKVQATKEHPVAKNLPEYTQFSVQFSADAHKCLKHTVNMVNDGTIVCTSVGGKPFSMSDAVVFLLRIAMYHLMAH